MHSGGFTSSSRCATRVHNTITRRWQVFGRTTFDPVVIQTRLTNSRVRRERVMSAMLCVMCEFSFRRCKCSSPLCPSVGRSRRNQGCHRTTVVTNCEKQNFTGWWRMGVDHGWFGAEDALAALILDWVRSVTAAPLGNSPSSRSPCRPPNRSHRPGPGATLH